MGCKQLFVNLGGGGSTTPDGALKVAGGVAIDATIRNITDNLGNASILNLSNASANIGSSTITNNGILTVKGSGGNIISGRNSSNVEKFYLANNGELKAAGNILTGNGNFIFTGLGRIFATADGIFQLMNNGFTDFTGLKFGGDTASFPYIKKSGATIQIKLADDSGLAQLESLKLLTGAPDGSTPKSWKLGAYSAGETIIPTGAAYIDIDGTTYKIAVST